MAGSLPCGACDAQGLSEVVRAVLQDRPAQVDNRLDFNVSLELILTQTTRVSACNNFFGESIRGKILIPTRRGCEKLVRPAFPEVQRWLLISTIRW